MKSYYYADIDELNDLRIEYQKLSVENTQLRQEINKLTDEIISLKKKKQSK